MKKNYTLLLLLSIFIFSCKKDGSPEEEGTGRDLVLTQQEQQKAEADNEFTFKLFKKALTGQQAGKNIMLSPLSVSMAVGMASNGSAGQTLEGIRTAMEFKNFTEAQVNSYYQKLSTELPELDPKATLKIANSIWYDKDFTALPAFLKVNKDYYNATAEGLDFNSAGAKARINGWVNEKTNGKIPTIVDQIPQDMVMYLINAVYFKSNWTYKFDKNNTAKGDFYLGNDQKVQADFMTTKATLNMATAQDASIYELPYGNKKYSMVIAIPAGNKPVAEFAADIDQAKWKGWMNGMTESTQDIRMPKFKFSYDITLNNALIGLGMGLAFGEGGNADFTRINAAGNLQIDEVKHKTFIEVNEEGTEAAAVTSVGIVLTSLGPSVVINRPFLFAIREMKTGLILFAGIVNNPLLDK
jgi:serine protease inhibitor